MTKINWQQHQKSRTRKGSVIVEFVCVAWMLILVALVSVDAGICAFAAWTNDAACRDAVRAAAQQNTAARAQQAALAAAKQFGSPIASIGTPQVDLSNFEYQTFPDANGNPQIDKDPFVRVSTSVSVQLPTPIYFNGAELSNKITFRQSYIFPIVRLQ